MPADVGGNWWDLVSLLCDDRLISRESRQRPTACLDCAGPLETGPSNQLFCRFDGNRY